MARIRVQCLKSGGKICSHCRHWLGRKNGDFACDMLVACKYKFSLKNWLGLKNTRKGKGEA